MQNSYQKRFWAVLLCVLALSLAGVAQEKSAAKKAAAAGPALQKAYLQKIWDGWATLNPANVAEYYAKGSHVFFDIAPVKYNSWDEYQAGVTKVLSDYKSAKLTLNDDTEIHGGGDMAWVTSTVASQLTTKSGKVEMATMRWTAVLHKQEGKWVIVHEHVSEPIQ
jgi:ketosteroid isomerase-like protein